MLRRDSAARMLRSRRQLLTMVRLTLLRLRVRPQRLRRQRRQKRLHPEQDRPRSPLRPRRRRLHRQRAAPPAPGLVKKTRRNPQLLRLLTNPRIKEAETIIVQPCAGVSRRSPRRRRKSLHRNLLLHRILEVRALWELPPRRSRRRLCNLCPRFPTVEVLSPSPTSFIGRRVKKTNGADRCSPGQPMKCGHTPMLC
jgi:hypothetical protein